MSYGIFQLLFTYTHQVQPNICGQELIFFILYWIVKDCNHKSCRALKKSLCAFVVGTDVPNTENDRGAVIWRCSWDQ